MGLILAKSPRALWNPLQEFFVKQGLHLWLEVGKPMLDLYPPNDSPRLPDGFAYRIAYTDLSTITGQFAMVVRRFAFLTLNGMFYLPKNPIQCAARTDENRDVLIRLVAIGQDRDTRHRKALDRLAKGNDASHGDNHVVPILREIVNNDKIFAVFPLMKEGFSHPWYYVCSEVFDAVEQILEASVPTP